MVKVGVFGLGSMGYGIAQSVLRAGHEVFGYDVQPELTVRFMAEGGQGDASGDKIRLLDMVIIAVVNADQTERVLFGEKGIVASLRRGAVVISCATVPPVFARSMEERLADLGILYLDCPMSGGASKAAEGALTLMASGSQAAFAAAKPALDAMAQKIFTLGDKAGPGSAMKIVNQLLAGVHIAAAAEAMTFGISQGVSPAQTLEVISECAGSSWMFENRGPHIVDGDYTPHSAVDIFVKDLGIVSDIARQVRFSTPLASAALQQFLAASGMGFGGEDDAAVAKVYAQLAGLSLPGDE